MIKIRKVIEKWKIWNKKEKAARLEKEAKKLVPKQFYKCIKIFRKKASERMPTRKMWDHKIDLKEEFMLRKGKIYLLFRKENEEEREFV